MWVDGDGRAEGREGTNARGIERARARAALSKHVKKQHTKSDGQLHSLNDHPAEAKHVGDYRADDRCCSCGHGGSRYNSCGRQLTVSKQ